jgi:TldD protein
MKRHHPIQPRFAAILLALLLFAFALPAVFGQQKSDTPAKDDLVLAAMRAELERSKAQLKMEQVAAPYYVEYRVSDLDQYSAEAAFGALRVDVRNRFRFLRVVVRIGDYKQDSYYGQGEGTLDFMPLDDDMLAFRHQLWLATDRAYKAAAESLTAKQAQLKQLTIDQPVDDFAHADPVQSIAPLAQLDIDPAPYRKMLEDASALYKTDPALESFEARLGFHTVNRYLVNSEGTVVRSGQNYYEMTIDASTQAADGMSLTRDTGYTVLSTKELPSAADFVDRARKLAATLRELRDAPLVEEEYRGPVLFSAHAATTIFSSLVGENILGHKPELGKNARTTGAFAASYKTRVLPDFVSVVSDPTIASYADKSLLGHYEIDDEGVRAQRVSVIEKGVLVNYLLGREPIRDFPASNGHARSQMPAGAPVPHNSNLIVTSSQPVSKDELMKKLIELCQQRDLPFGYFVETFGPRLTPRLIYKVWTKDGHQELVRGAEFGELDVRALRSGLIAAGDDSHVDNHMQNIPHSIVAPSILFDELEVKRANANKEKLPEYPAPTVGN